jgi:glycerophosphoryl diester phosphodiesterase
MQSAVELGVTSIECDVHLSADGEVVVCHDATVDRTTDGTGAIATLPWAALREFDAGARWSPHADPERANGGLATGARPFAGRGIGLPRLAEVLETFPGVSFIIEFKSAAVARPALELLERMGARSRVLIGSFLTDALHPARAAGFRTTASQAELIRLLPVALLRGSAARPPFDALAIPPRWRGLPVPIAGFGRSLEVPVYVWTVNDPDHARRLLAGGVSGIITDDPGRLLPLAGPGHRSTPAP